MTTPATLSATDFRKELRFRAARLEEVVAALPNERPVTATVKVDGELEVFAVDVPAGVVTLTNRNERQRVVRPIAAELLAALRRRGHQSMRGAGELYAVRGGAGPDAGRPLPFEQTIGQVRARAYKTTPAADQQQLRLAVFDIFELDGRQLWRVVPYAERFALLYSLFMNGEHFVRPVIGQTLAGREADPIQALWKQHVLAENFEGLVLRTNGAIKVKPIHTLDLAVIGIQAGRGKAAGRMGALVTAFRDWSGRFISAGKVGTGFTDAERAWWWQHVTRLPKQKLPKQASEPDRVFVVPQRVIEVEAERFNHRQAPAWHWHAPTRRWARAGSQPSALMQKPRFVRVRDDKSLTPYDLRLEQVPGFGADHAKIRIPDPGTDGARFREQLTAVRPDVARFASKLHVPAGDFEDLLQDTYVKALQGWERLEAAGKFAPGAGMPEPGRPLVTWLYTIFANAWTSLQRKRQVRRRRAVAATAGQLTE
ncbi:MAG: sigma factor, partial [Gemmatimonadales bacterium]|nr:sigma factor [Gemmatimonadales bacterium]